MAAAARGAGPATRLLIEYDGTGFHGWARQPGLRTVQGELERALALLLRRPQVTLSVAGRTDAGVHASGQVASYAGEPVRAEALNALLPHDVAVLACEAAPPGFDARRDATSRAYAYRILARPARSPHLRHTALHWPHRLDAGALSDCAALLEGVHDFTAFTPTDTEHVRFEREVLSAEWVQVRADLLELQIEADSFLRGMIRALVGTMLQVASGRRSLSQFHALLAGRPRGEAGPTAPPHGLHLLGASYDGSRILPTKRTEAPNWTNVR
ncbi:MAG TPA: tRNA pseudouridine(38-40) synthase TruA [Solirubrobacteraceae bacterium]|nr:tRNA pseudouridine(38-40) synthase TruA [Solirubrobacteraceae bacterium]